MDIDTCLIEHLSFANGTLHLLRDKPLHCTLVTLNYRQEMLAVTWRAINKWRRHTIKLRHRRTANEQKHYSFGVCFEMHKLLWKHAIFLAPSSSAPEDEVNGYASNLLVLCYNYKSPSEDARPTGRCCDSKHNNKRGRCLWWTTSLACVRITSELRH